MTKTTTKNPNLLSSRYGNCPELDQMIGNVKKVLKTGHPGKRYFTLSVDGEKTYHINLIEARWAVKMHPEAFREVSTNDLTEEVSTRGTKAKGRWAEVVTDTEDTIVFRFRGVPFTFSKQASV